MIQTRIYCIILAVLGNCAGNNLTIQYYENLVSQATASTESYIVPEKNVAFATGSSSNITEDFGSYDFIIVGAGTAGNVVATRLSEISEWNILLLEAGGEENDFSDIPSMNAILQWSEMNWGYTSTPQNYSCLGMKENKCRIPRGKVIGGTSVLNGMMYVRGNRDDYDKWGKLVDKVWNYKNVLPYFKKSENSQINGDLTYHGKGGLWNVEYALPSTDLFEYLIRGNAELSIPYVDYNGRRQLGISRTQSNIKYGRRQSTGTAFLANSRKRKNLKVVTKALVTQIIIDKQNKVAQGVLFVTNNKKFKAFARKEVIVSGGTINTPQLLMLSGIGPKKHLNELKIDVIEDLPVGQNYLEHPMFVGLAFKTNYTHTNSTMEEQLVQYLNGLGPLTRSINCEAIGFTQVGRKTNNAPTIEYMYLPPNGGNPRMFGKVANYNDEIINDYLLKKNPNSDLSIYVVLLHPKSRGQLTLKSNDPIDFPDVNVNMFAEAEDVAVLTKGIEFILDLAKTEAFKKINATFLDIPFCEKFEKFSKKFWDCAIRTMAITIYHPCGTAAMGRYKTSSVVDKNLKVHGIKKLRVVDASVFPTTISGHTSGPVVMIAEKISDVIKMDFKNYL